MATKRYQLIGIAGANKGGCWPLDAGALVFGRGDDCDIVVVDPVVSRRHCRVAMDDGHVRLDDLGSRNTTLVNGTPAGRADLETGDEIAIGNDVFLLTSAAPATTHSEERVDTPDTHPMIQIGGGNEVVRMAGADGELRPRTIHDLAQLFETTRAFSTARSIDDLLGRLRECLTQRLEPSGLWVARLYGIDNLAFYKGAGGELPSTNSSASRPETIMRQALMERRGVLVHTKADRGSADLLVTVLAAPILAGDAALGVVGVRTETRPGQRRQADLEFLEILAQSFGPFLHAVEHQEQLRRDNERLRARAGESNTLVGNSPAIQEVVAKIAKVAPTDLNVLITGETGTGKELAARMVHNCSRRRSNPLIVVNCAAIPRELFESELFGYEKGAFTGAQRSTAGLLSRAHGGTLFLDEIGDLSLENQARILRAIEYGTFRPVGGNRERRVDIRVVAATNRHIPAAIEDGEFRTDLFHRLNGFEISLPPLRERRSDIPLLAEHFFTMNRDQAKRPLSGFASEALEALQEYNWPGNVRQLRHTVQRAIAIARDEEIRSDDLGLAQQEAAAGSMDDEPPLPLKEVERNHLQQVLALHNGNVREAARALGIARSTLYKKITEYDLAQQPAR